MAFVLVVIIEYLLCALFMFLGPRSTDCLPRSCPEFPPGWTGFVLCTLGACIYDVCPVHGSSTDVTAKRVIWTL